MHSEHDIILIDFENLRERNNFSMERGKQFTNFHPVH